MTHPLPLIVAESLRALALTSPMHAALLAEVGHDRAVRLAVDVLRRMTAEERRNAVMAATSWHAQLAADVIHLDAGGEYDRGADLLGNAAGYMRDAVGAYPARHEAGGVLD